MPPLPQALPSNTNFFASVPLDLFILALFAAVVAIDSFRSGTRRAAVFCIAAPLSVLLYNILLNARFVGSMVAQQSAVLQAGIFIALLILTFVLVYKMMPESAGSGSLALQGIVGATAAAAIFAVVWIQMPLLTSLRAPSPMIQLVFGPDFRFFWLLGAYIALAFTRR